MCDAVDIRNLKPANGIFSNIDQANSKICTFKKKKKKSLLIIINFKTPNNNAYTYEHFNKNKVGIYDHSHIYLTVYLHIFC